MRREVLKLNNSIKYSEKSKLKKYLKKVDFVKITHVGIPDVNKNIEAIISHISSKE